MERGGRELKSCEISWEDLYTWAHFSSMLFSTHHGPGIAVHSPLWTPEGRARSRGAAGRDRAAAEWGCGGNQGAPPRSVPALAVCSPLSPPRALVPLSYVLCVLPGGGGAPVATGSEACVPLTHGSLCPSSVMLTHAYPSRKALLMTPPQKVFL